MRLPTLIAIAMTLTLTQAPLTKADSQNSQLACGTLDPSMTDHYEKSVSYLWSQVPEFDAPLFKASFNSLRCLERVAKAQEPNAMAWMGAMYLQGAGVKPDRKRGEMLLGDAAKLGSPFASFALAVFHDEGVLLRRDSAASMRHMLEAAAGDHPHALWAVGEAYLNGQGVEQDKEKGLKYLEAAVASGQPLAPLSLSDVYLRGQQGVEVDYAKALLLLSTAAQKGDRRIRSQLYRAQDFVTKQQFDYLDAESPADQFWDAAENKRIEVLKFMIELGVAPDERKGRLGTTVLHLAASKDLVDVVTLLLAEGADPILEDYKGETPIDYALKFEAKKSEELLRNARRTSK